MARSIRHVSPTHFYLLTNRCVLGTHLLRPDEEACRILKGCLARAADRHDVELVCFVFLSNHFHLIARFPNQNMGEFMGTFQGQVASRINDHRGRSGTVFPRRYDDEILLDGQALEDKIGYVLNNPLHHDLVPAADAWPGVNSFGLHEEGEPLRGRWLNSREWTKLKRRKTDHDREEAMETYTVELHLPETLGGGGALEAVADGGTDPADRRRRLLEIVRQDRRRRWAERTGAVDRPPPGMFAPDEIREMDWRRRPEESPSSPFDGRRLGVASNVEAICEYEEFRRDLSERYRTLSEAWREGDDIEPEEFPAGTYPPTCQHCVGHESAG